MQYGRWNREQDQHIALELVKSKRVRPCPPRCQEKEGAWRRAGGIPQWGTLK